MSFRIFNPAPETDLKNRLELVSRIGAIALLMFYVAGFLVVTFANASRGIVGFGFLRAKILTAGILFWFFMMLPLIDWSRAFGKFGFPQTELESKTISFGIVKLFRFIMASWAMAFFLCNYVLGCALRWRFLLLYVVFLGVGVAVSMMFSKHPITSALLSIGLTGVGIVGLIFLKEHQLLLLLGWFIFVSFTADLIESDVREARHPRNINWHWRVIDIVFTVGFFATLLYPKISPKLGGGQPTQVVFQFASQSPIDGLTKNQLWMLDEVDAGYYVVKDPNEHKAIFIPRASVSAIYFDAEHH